MAPAVHLDSIMKVSSLMRPDPVTCRTLDTCEHAAGLMRDHAIGCLPVTDEHGRVAGVVTDRDLCMAALDRGALLAAIPVTAAMSSPVHTCAPDDSVDVAEAWMMSHRVRRLPVVDHDGLPIGILSVDDLARAYGSHRVASTEVASTLASVVAPEHGDRAR
jgi:CBS domain-containing protein